jgi:phenylalanine-4-hydroxylase
MVSQSTKYNHLFENVIPNAVGGIRIFGKNDNYAKPQDYDNVLNLENRIWAELFQNLEFLLDQYSSREYLLGLRSLPIPNNMFPEFDAISPLIENSTGWTLISVAGFLDEELFFDINKKRQFPVTEIIRQSPRFAEKYAGIDIQNDDGYTPEPDIFHDIQGHIPFLMNKKYADFMWEIGVLGDEIIKDERGLGLDLVAHNLKRLQNFAWWTYEFGLIKNTGDTDPFRRVANDMDYEIYGAGIISSFDEVTNVVKCAKGESSRSKFLPYNIEEMIMTCFDYSNIQDRYYVIDSMDSLYKSFRANQQLFWFEG